MLINISSTIGASNIITKELNIPTYISLADENNIVSSWSNKTYAYYTNIMIGNIEYALYIDNSESIQPKNKLVKILLPIV